MNECRRLASWASLPHDDSKVVAPQQALPHDDSKVVAPQRALPHDDSNVVAPQRAALESIYFPGLWLFSARTDISRIKPLKISA